MVTPIDWFIPSIQKNIVKAYMLNKSTRWKFGSIKYKPVDRTVEITLKGGKVRNVIDIDDVNKFMYKKGLHKEYYGGK